MGMGGHQPRCGHNSPGSGEDFEDYEYPDEWHHQFPKQFRDEFEKEGIDIEDYGIWLPKDVHRLKSGCGLHTGDDNWNKEWEDFFEDNTDAEIDDKEEKLEEMQDYYGLGEYL